MANKNIAEIKAELLPAVTLLADGAAPRLGSWVFEEVHAVLNDLPDDPLKTLSKQVVEFFSGARARQDLIVALQAA